MRQQQVKKARQRRQLPGFTAVILSPMMTRSLSLATALLLLPAVICRAQRMPDGDYPRIHDPSTVVEDKDGVWCLSTGQGAHRLKREADGRWRKMAPLISEFPAWHKVEVPENKGHLW